MQNERTDTTEGGDALKPENGPLAAEGSRGKKARAVEYCILRGSHAGPCLYAKVSKSFWWECGKEKRRWR